MVGIIVSVVLTILVTIIGIAINSSRKARVGQTTNSAHQLDTLQEELQARALEIYMENDIDIEKLGKMTKAQRFAILYKDQKYFELSEHVKKAFHDFEVNLRDMAKVPANVKNEEGKRKLLSNNETESTLKEIKEELSEHIKF